MKLTLLIALVFAGAVVWVVAQTPAPKDSAAGGTVTPASAAPPSTNSVPEKIVKSEEEWQKLLTPEQFRVCRKKGTERAFTGSYWNLHDDGIYQCVACGLPLFSSDTKFESGTGWPSFWTPISTNFVGTLEDSSFFMRRVEVHCARCQAHLGHVFPDGPKPTGLRYCINSVSLKFEKKSKEPAKP